MFKLHFEKNLALLGVFSDIYTLHNICLFLADVWQPVESPVCFCFLSEVNFKLFDWLVDHFREISKGQLIKECFSFSQPLRAGVFFSPSDPPLPPTFPETTVENLLDHKHLPITREHTETPALQATIPLVWRAFSLDERIIVDGRPIRINKAAFSNFSWVVWTGLQYSITNQT